MNSQPTARTAGFFLFIELDFRLEFSSLKRKARPPQRQPDFSIPYKAFRSKYTK